MPRRSAKFLILKTIDDQLNHYLFLHDISYLMDWKEDYEEEVEFLYERFRTIESERYFLPRVHLKSTMRWQDLLHDERRFNDNKFLAHFRMNRLMFWNLYYGLIRTWNEVLRRRPEQSAPGGRPSDPFELRLLTFLKFIGTNGTDGSLGKVGELVGCSTGSVVNFVEDVVGVILLKKTDYLGWPEPWERQRIARDFSEDYDFPHCIGIVDGTLFPLKYKPSANGEDYYTRKGNYALHGLIFTDNHLKIRWIELGWPGSVHDNRVWRNCRLHREAHRHFDSYQYVMGDSAFTPSSIMVPAYKKPPGAQLTMYQDYFNKKLASVRIKSEHAIGLLKARFPRLDGLRCIINSKEDMEKTVKIIVASVCLHNFLIHDRLAHDWLEVNANDDDDEQDEEEGGYDFQLLQEANGTERREQAMIDLLDRTGVF